MCTRTHSQISQFINEIKKVPFFCERLVVVPLTSRKGLCVHPKIKLEENLTRLTDRCQDLCESKNGCLHADREYLPFLEDHLIEETHDIEELAQRAQQHQICGYFAARSVAIETADVIVTTYQNVLSEATRQAVGLETLAGKLLVFDEAHNLMEAIGSMNSVSLNLDHLNGAKEALIVYIERYGKRMNPANTDKLRELVKILGSLVDYLSGKHSKGQPHEIVQVMDLLMDT